jgi:hypothetical protein
MTRKGFPLALLRLTVLVALLALAAVFYAAGPLNQDTSFLVVAADRWLRGAVLYRDIMETNPPLIFYLTAPAVLLAKVLHMDASAVFVMLLCALILVSMIWCWSLLARAPEIGEFESLSDYDCLCLLLWLSRRRKISASASISLSPWRCRISFCVSWSRWA